MLLVNQKAYITAPNKNLVYVVDAQTDVVSDSISVGASPSALGLDAQNNLWVLCAGSSWTNPVQMGAIYKIDVAQNTVLNHIDLDPIYPAKMAINSNENVLYFIQNGVQKLDLNSMSYAEFLPMSAAQSFYGIAYNSENQSLYVSDAKDFVSKGLINIYDQQGNLKSSVEAGVNPSSFYFY